jgi:zinc protease
MMPAITRRTLLAGSAVLFAPALLREAASQSRIRIERVVSPGGIVGWLVTDRKLPLLMFEFAFRGGAARVAPGREGLARMFTNLLTEGAGELDSRSFTRELEDRSISISFGSDWDSLSGSLRVLTEQREHGVRLLQLALTRPRFDTDAVERVRAQMLAGLQRTIEAPPTLAGRAWYSTAFPDHPYGRTQLGTAQSLSAIARDDLTAFQAARLARDNLIVAAAGDISAAEFGALLDGVFGDLPARADQDVTPRIEAQGAGKTIVIGRTLPQSYLMFGHGGMLRSDPDFYAATILNDIFGGGGFSSRLMEEIRERRGLTYGVYTSVSAYARTGLVLGTMSTDNPKAGEALGLIRNEWRRMREEGPTAEEFDGSKSSLIGGFALRFDALRPIARFLVSMQWENLGIDFIERRNGLIGAVTLDDAKRVARRLLDPDKLLVVVVGRPEGVTATETRGQGG